MPVKKYLPTSPGRRFQTAHDFSELSKERPEKSLTVGLRSTFGKPSGK